MKVPPRRHKCPHCKELFLPDPRNRYHQRFCSKPSCQKARKATNQRVWSQRPNNRDYWRGADEVARVRAWRQAHPGYWKKARNQPAGALQVVISAEPAVTQPVNPALAGDALQVVSPMQHPWVVGLISMFTGATLQDDIVATHRRLVVRG